MAPPQTSPSPFSFSSIQQTLVNTSTSRIYGAGFAKPTLPRSSSPSNSSSRSRTTLVAGSGSSVKSAHSTRSISSGSSSRTLNALASDSSLNEKFHDLSLTSSNPLPLSSLAPDAHAQAQAREHTQPQAPPQSRKSIFSSLFSSNKTKTKTKTKANANAKSKSKSVTRRPPPLHLHTADMSPQTDSSQPMTPKTPWSARSAGSKLKSPRAPLFDWRLRNHHSYAVQGGFGGRKRTAGWGLLVHG